MPETAISHTSLAVSFFNAFATRVSQNGISTTAAISIREAAVTRGGASASRMRSAADEMAATPARSKRKLERDILATGYIVAQAGYLIQSRS